MMVEEHPEEYAAYLLGLREVVVGEGGIVKRLRLT